MIQAIDIEIDLARLRLKSLENQKESEKLLEEINKLLKDIRNLHDK